MIWQLLVPVGFIVLAGVRLWMAVTRTVMAINRDTTVVPKERPPKRAPKMIHRTATLVAMAMAAFVGTTAASAQRDFEILVDSGRTIVGSITHDFGPRYAIDAVRGIIYVVESRDPFVVEARSLHDGAVVTRYGRGRGGGPGELEWISAIAADGENVFIADGRGVHLWSIAGELKSFWVPEAPGPARVCAFGGQPAVPLHPTGVAVRTPAGSARPIGADGLSRALRLEGVPDDEDEVIFISRQFRRLNLACRDNIAYVLREDDVPTAYSENEPPREIPLPAELVAQARRIQEGNSAERYSWAYTYMSLDADGRLFVTQWNNRLAGVITDPGTGAYRLLRDNARHRNSRWYMGMYRDSVVARRAEPTTEIINGRPTTVVYAEPSHISIYPVRAVSDPSGRGGHDG